jgi:hypothetical protein
MEMVGWAGSVGRASREASPWGHARHCPGNLFSKFTPIPDLCEHIQQEFIPFHFSPFQNIGKWIRFQRMSYQSLAPWVKQSISNYSPIRTIIACHNIPWVTLPDLDLDCGIELLVDQCCRVRIYCMQNLGNRFFLPGRDDSMIMIWHYSISMQFKNHMLFGNK